jgi:hypothetical protein
LLPLLQPLQLLCRPKLNPLLLLRDPCSITSQPQCVQQRAHNNDPKGPKAVRRHPSKNPGNAPSQILDGNGNLIADVDPKTGYFNILNHPIRSDYFKWDDFWVEINKIRPENPLEINWDTESEYYNTDAKEKYRIHYLEQRTKIYNASDLFIYGEINSNSPRIERIKWMDDNLDVNETKYSCRKLEDLLDDFNPAEKLVDTSKQEAELSIIRNQFNLKEEIPGRLWKLLLKRKADAIGFGQLYNELKVILDKNGVNIVSLNHFETTWVNPNSDSLIPRGNKVFRIICDYLNLPSSYRLIMYRIKNQSIKGKISATRTFSRLLKDLFYDKCFDEGCNLKIILENRIEYYNTYHNLEEMGINENDSISSLIILIDLLKPEIHLLKIKSIEKVVE